MSEKKSNTNITTNINTNCHLTPDTNTHNVLNAKIQLEDEIEYWQDKLLEIKLKNNKDVKNINHRINTAQEQYTTLTQKNSTLHSQIDAIKSNIAKLKKLHSDEEELKLDKEIEEYESKNSTLHNEFLQKMNHLKALENPEYLMQQILKFEPEVVKNLCMKLNNLQNEKMNYYMNMQKQYYNQMYYNQYMFMNGQGQANGNSNSNGNSGSANGEKEFLSGGMPGMQGYMGSNITSDINNMGNMTSDINNMGNMSNIGNMGNINSTNNDTNFTSDNYTSNKQ